MRGARGIDFGAYARGLLILAKFPAVILGPILAGVLIVLLHLVMPGGDGFAGMASLGLAGLFEQLIRSFGIAIAIVVADAAWRFGRAPFDDAWEQARQRGGDILMATFGVGFVTFVAAQVGSVLGTFGSLALFAVASFFLLYALPAAAIGGVPGFGALQISVERACANVPPTLVLALVYFVAVAIAPSIVLEFLEPHLIVPNTILASPSVPALILVLVQAPFQAYAGIMLAKTYAELSYGRYR